MNEFRAVQLSFLKEGLKVEHAALHPCSATGMKPLVAQHFAAASLLKEMLRLLCMLSPRKVSVVRPRPKVVEELGRGSTVPVATRCRKDG